MLLACGMMNMASESSELLYCYNRGCGSKFNPKNNTAESCSYHPGYPIFHDAYKGWSCCNKKSIDFNEFLNIKGCVKSFHSDVKPPEPVVPKQPKSDEVIEVKSEESKVPAIERPPLNTPLVKMEPVISSTLKSQLLSLSAPKPETLASSEIKIGTSCKNSGCKEEYRGPESSNTECVYHSGIPVFHEGLKFWSCCNKKTTDFAVFLEQVGCTTGDHVWLKEKSNTNQSNIRYDWHQTGSHVFISVYAKMCDPDKSVIELNPIRVKIHLRFLSDDSCFDKDLELYGVVDVAKCGVTMMPTKVEVKLKKAESGNWVKLSLCDIANGRNESGEGEAVAKGDGETVAKGGKTECDEDDIIDLKGISLTSP